MHGKLGPLLRVLPAAGILALVLLLLPGLDKEAAEATAAAALDAAAARLDERLGERNELAFSLVVDESHRALAERHLARLPRLRPDPAGVPLHVTLESLDDGGKRAVLRIEGAAAAEATQAPIRPRAILPPLVAILLAFLTGRLLLSLSIAVILGGILAAGFHPLALGARILLRYGWEATLSDPFKLWIFAFTACLIGMVAVATRAGGVHGVVEKLARVVKGRRSAQAITWLMGISIFFDDYANTILVGGTMRPLSDRMRISREKLAFIVDSTSAPIAALAVISTWIGYEVGLLGELSRSLGMGLDGYAIFFSALPFRFYCVFVLVFGALLVCTGRDFGPMLRAERRAVQTGQALRPGARPLAQGGLRPVEAKPGIPSRPQVAIVPVAVVLAATLLGILWDGGALPEVARAPASLLHFGLWRDAFAAAENSTFVLAMATLAGSAVVFAQVFSLGLLTPREAGAAYVGGVRSMGPAIATLTLAWAIKAVCDDLGTSQLLVATLQDVVHPAALPLLIFFLAAAVAFATGTSWGTMGILIPTAAPLAFHLAGPEAMFLSLAAVLDGAIFGDHASPLSDTSVMSSIATGSDLMDHVRTQLPYAALAMGVASLFGYGWNALGLGLGLGYLLGALALAGTLLLFGRRADLLDRGGLDGAAAAPISRDSAAAAERAPASGAPVLRRP